MKVKALNTAAGIALTAGVAATMLGAGTADAAVPKYNDHGIKLTRSQTDFVAQHGIGNAIAAFPSIPNLIYNPTFGRVIQLAAVSASHRGGCISFGIGTPKNGKGGNSNYVTVHPKRACAR